MPILISFLPMLLFITIYLGSSLYFLAIGTERAFYQISPNVAIIPALLVGWAINKRSTKETMDCFLEGARHRDIMTMCFIFLLAGAFSGVTKTIGSVDAVVNLALSLLPTRLLLVGVFMIAAIISTAIGSSMGTIAALGPITVGLAQQATFPIALGMATVVSGAMFGDNLSLISDTTLAAVMSQSADRQLKLKVNLPVSIIAAVITSAILVLIPTQATLISLQDYAVVLLLPYVFLIALTLSGSNVLVVLVLALLFAGMIGLLYTDYSIGCFSRDIVQGFNSMHEIMVLSLLVGGLSGLANKPSVALGNVSPLLPKQASKKAAALLIAAVAAVFDILLANNTVAIICSGRIAKGIAKQYNLSKHASAAWLDIFSCVFQGIIPYGAQILLASTIAAISPLAIIGQVYYCYVLGIVAVSYILFKKSP